MQNTDYHEPAPTPPAPFHVERVPGIRTAPGMYGDWAVISADGRIVSAWMHRETADIYAREMNVPDDTWRDRWESWADSLPVEPVDWY